MSKIHQSVVRNQGHTRVAVSHVERHNERKNENYSNIDVVLEQSHNNIYYKICDGTYLGTFDKMVQDGEISTRGLKLNSEGTKPESAIVAEMVFDVNTEYFDSHYESHGYASAYDFAKHFYYDAYKMAVEEVGDEKYILAAVMHADERNKGVSEKLGRDVYHYHLHVTYIPVVQKEIKWTKKCKDKSLVGKVKEVINQVNHSKKWECEKAVGEDGKEYLVYSYSKLQDRYHDHMKVAGYHSFERGKEGSTAEHLAVMDYKAKMRQEELDAKEKALAEKEIELAGKADELTEKENRLKLADMELEDVQKDIDRDRAVQADLKSEKSELQAERDDLKNEVAPIRELQKLKTKTEEIKIPDKPSFGSNVKIPYSDLVKLKKMADTYIANESEIKNVRTRRSDVAKREGNAATREKNVKHREDDIKGKEDLLNSAATVKSERDELQIQANHLSRQLQTVTAKLQQAFDVISNIVKAAKLLHLGYDHTAEYKVENLTPKQEALISALYEYGAKAAAQNNFAEHAKSMRGFMKLDDDILAEMKKANPELFPQEKQKSRSGYSRDGR